MSIKHTTNSDEGSELRAHCNACQNNTRHHVVQSLRQESQAADWWTIELFQIIQCRGCGAPSFRYEREDPDSEQYDDEGKSYCNSQVKLYPPRKGKAEINNSHLLPVNLQGIYREVIAATNAQMPILTGVGLRTLIEAICRDLDAGGTLKQMIDFLATKGNLRPAEAEILHALRLAGNASAHEAQGFPQKELSNALSAVEHIIKTIYLLQHEKPGLPLSPT